jgi:YfiH family protein
LAAVVSSIFDEFEWIEHEFGTRDTISFQDDMASLKQIHSATVLPVGLAGCAGEGDGLVCCTPAVAVSVRTADCFPILIADVRNRAVAAVHAGWRGTAAGIVPAAIRLMHSEFGTRTADVVAAIGPGIGGCCYQVGEDVMKRFGSEGAGHIDLGQINREQLIAAGVPPAHIDRVDACTFCDAHRFHSYRRDNDTAGRMISFIRIRPNG